MIDWVTATICCDNTLKTGCVAKISPDNEIEWLSQSAIPVRGSHDVNVMVKPLSQGTIIVSGNPAKWLQGHNLFGINDLKRLMNVFFKSLHEVLSDDGLSPTFEQLSKIENGFYTVSRVDINETWHLNNQDEVKSWIRSAGEKMHMQHRGKGVFSGDTLYWGKGSKYWYLKCYSKGDEINRKKSNFPDYLRTPQMLEYADKSLRLEIVLCSNFLRQTQFNWVCHWSPDTAKMLLLNYLSKLEMSNNFMLSDDVLHTLPRKLQVYYKLWLQGEDLRYFMSKPTFYRVRKQFKDYDIDIALLRDKEQVASNVIPLIKVLEAEPVGIPKWAYEQNLVAC